MIPVLMIALEFAPVQTTGAFRSIDFARYLPEFGIKPIVVTIDPAQGAAIFNAPINQSLVAGLPASVEIETLTPNQTAGTARPEGRLQSFLRIAGTLDDRFHQRFHAALAARLPAIAKAHAPQAVYVSAPPFGAARLGEQAARTLGLPWILDMRDAWAEWGMAPMPTWLHYAARRRDERRAFAHADAVLTVTDRLRGVFRHAHPALPASKFHVIANGFDGPSMAGATIPAQSPGDTCNIAYVGSYYYTPPKPRSLRRPHALLHYSRGHEDWSYRSPLYFFRAWQALEAIDAQAAARIRFHHIGTKPPWLEGMARAHGVADQCVFHGQLPKQAVATALAGMDAQLATSMKRPDGGDYCLASKTFDYITARKPILAFVTDGSQRDFLAASGAAILCDPDDAAVSAQILRAFTRDGASLGVDGGFLDRFHRREGARRLAGLVRHLVSGDALTDMDAIA